MIAVAAASGAMAVAAPVPAAFAAPGASADGAAVGSPGLISGNTVQVPVHAPVNLCGNTVNVVGLLNPAAGNRCGNGSGGGSAYGPGGRDARGWAGAHGGAESRGWAGTHGGAGAHGGAGTHSGAGRHGGAYTHGGAGRHGGGASASGGGIDSSGVLSGSGVQLPVELPVNLIGNSVNVIGVGNAAVGNESVNTQEDSPTVPDRPVRPDLPVRPAHRPPPPKANPGRRSAPPQHVTGALAHTGADRTAPAVLGSAALILGGAIVYRRYRPQAAR
ncbi:chaplin [Streptomyces sp. NPDC050997]|uniref:chaplin n=1 Tax=Streptomyces sp. NPDC050997 TaxID=3155519 RepID=UPI003431D26E